MVFVMEIVRSASSVRLKDFLKSIIVSELSIPNPVFFILPNQINKMVMNLLGGNMFAIYIEINPKIIAVGPVFRVPFRIEISQHRVKTLNPLLVLYFESFLDKFRIFAFKGFHKIIFVDYSVTPHHAEINVFKRLHDFSVFCLTILQIPYQT